MGHLAAATEYGVATVWDPATGRQLHEIRNAAQALAFTPDGQALITGQWEKVEQTDRGLMLTNRLGLKMSDPATGKELRMLRGPDLHDVHGVAVSPDGRQVAAVDLGDTLSVWDTTTGQVSLTIHGATSGAAFSPDGTTLASANPQEKAIKFWDVSGDGPRAARKVGTIRGADRSVAYSPDGRYLAGASHGATLKIWNAEAGAEALALPLKSGGQSFTCAFSPDGSRLATGWGMVMLTQHLPNRGVVSATQQVAATIWDPATGRQLLALGALGERQALRALAYSPDGRSIASVSSWNGEPADPDCEVKLWDAGTGRERQTLRRPNTRRLWGLVFSPDCQRLALGGEGDTLEVCDVETGQSVLTVPTRALNVAFSPDGGLVATASGGFFDGMGEVRLWDAVSGAPVDTLRVHRYEVTPITALAFSDDGRKLAAATSNSLVHMDAVTVWDVASGDELHVLRGHAGAVRCVAFCPDGDRLVSGGDDQMVKVWDVADGKLVLTLRGHSRAVTGVTFSPDGNRLASVSGDSSRIWDGTPPAAGPAY
jgi:WD40 repeat protein